MMPHLRFYSHVLFFLWIYWIKPQNCTEGESDATDSHFMQGDHLSSQRDQRVTQKFKKYKVEKLVFCEGEHTDHCVRGLYYRCCLFLEILSMKSKKIKLSEKLCPSVGWLVGDKISTGADNEPSCKLWGFQCLLNFTPQNTPRDSLRGRDTLGYTLEHIQTLPGCPLNTTPIFWSKTFGHAWNVDPPLSKFGGFNQSCEISNLLHGATLPNQILPQEKRVYRDKFNTQKE